MFYEKFKKVAERRNRYVASSVMVK